MRPRVLVTCRQMQSCFEAFAGMFAKAGLEVHLPEIRGQQLSEAQLLRVIANYEGVIAGDDPFTSVVLRAATRLRVISKWGVGLDSIDQRTAAELGISVTNTPGMFDNEVADVTIAYLVILARSLHRIDRAMHLGEWCKIEGISLAGRTLGVVGLGGIGRGTARRARAMGMSIVGVDPAEEAVLAASSEGVRVVDFQELMRVSDAVALNCPLTEATEALVDAAALASARRGLLLVNTARGTVVDERALVDALVSGQVAAAALDVFEVEPLDSRSPLRAMDNVILGSHNASNTKEAVLRTSSLAVKNLIQNLLVDA